MKKLEVYSINRVNKQKAVESNYWLNGKSFFASVSVTL